MSRRLLKSRHHLLNHQMMSQMMAIKKRGKARAIKNLKKIKRMMRMGMKENRDQMNPITPTIQKQMTVNLMMENHLPITKMMMMSHLRKTMVNLNRMEKMNQILLMIPMRIMTKKIGKEKAEAKIIRMNLMMLRLEVGMMMGIVKMKMMNLKMKELMRKSEGNSKKKNLSLLIQATNLSKLEYKKLLMMPPKNSRVFWMDCK